MTPDPWDLGANRAPRMSYQILQVAAIRGTWASSTLPEAARGLKSLTHIERSEIWGYKLFEWDPTWGTCLEQSLFKINPGRLKMRNGGVLTNRETCGRTDTKMPFWKQIKLERITWSNFLPEVEVSGVIMGGRTFRNTLESEHSKNKLLVIANLGPTWDGRIWILGMLLILNSSQIYSPIFFI